MTELQERLLKLLKVTDELCRKYDVEYYLLGGTLIGAMRHGGFIPWDDDADVIMTRDNWDKFFRCANDNMPEGYKLSSQDDDINVGMPINRLTETDTTGMFRYHLSAPEIAGTQIDIFVMDPVPDTEEDRRIYREAIAEYSELCALHASFAFRYGKGTNFKKNWEHSLEVGRKQALEEIAAKAFHYKEEESQLYAQRFGGAPHFWPKEVFGKPQYVPFEDTMLMIPARPGDCLTIGYDDDWKYIPRGGPNLSTHDFAVRSYTTPSTVIWNDYLQHADNKALMDAFIERKYAWEEQFEEKFNLDLDTQKFIAARIELKYKKKLAGVDVRKLLKDKAYDKLHELFREYIEVQSNSKLVGSASLTGRIGYYRRNHPLLIDIGDDALYAVLRLLMHDQRLGVAVKMMRARKTIDRPLTAELAATDEELEKIRRVVSTYGCGEYDECRKLVDEGLKDDPEDPFFIKHDIFLKVKEDIDNKQKTGLINGGLAAVPHDSELLYLLSEVYREEGRAKEAIEIYDDLIGSSDDGIVLKHVKERCKELYDEDGSEENHLRWLNCRTQCGEDVSSDSLEDSDENVEVEVADNSEDGNPSSGKGSVLLNEGADTQEGLSAVQKCRLDLMVEFDKICRDNGLHYYLSGNALWQAITCGQYIDRNAGFAVLMPADDAVRFQDIVNSSDSNRTVESMLTNPKFYRVGMRFCDTDTLDMAVPRCSSIKYPCIGITIEIFRPREKTYLKERFNRFIEKGWEVRTAVRDIGWKTKTSKDYVDRMCERLGEDKAAQKVFRMLTKESKASLLGKDREFFIRRYNRRRAYFPGSLLSETSEVTLEGHSFITAKDPDALLRAFRGKRYDQDGYVFEEINEFGRLVDAEVSAQELRDYMEETCFSLDDYQARWKSSNWNYKKITAVSRMGSKHWYTLAACGKRQNFYDQYHDSKDVIMEAYREGDVEKVGELIKDYYEQSKDFARRDLVLFFDKDLFDVLIWYFNNNGREEEKTAAKLEKLLKEQNWTEIAERNEK